MRLVWPGPIFSEMRRFAEDEESAKLPVTVFGDGLLKDEVAGGSLGRYPPDSFYSVGFVNRSAGIICVEVEIDGFALAADEACGKEVGRIETAEAECRRAEGAKVFENFGIGLGKVQQIERYDVLRRNPNRRKREFLPCGCSEHWCDPQLSGAQVVTHFEISVPAWLEGPICSGNRLRGRFPLRGAELLRPGRMLRRCALSAKEGRAEEQEEQKTCGIGCARGCADHDRLLEESVGFPESA